MFKKWCIGYALIKITGKYPERFFNICVKNSIELWNVQRINDNEFVCYALLSNFKALKHSGTRSKCKIETIQRFGLVFFFKNMLKRKILIFSLLIFVLLLIIFNQFIWKIQFLSNDPYDIELINQVLQKNGIKIGSSKKNFDSDKINDMILDEFDDLSWVNCELKGMKIVVKFAVGSRAPNSIDFDKPCDIVASKNGIIKNFNIRYGDKKISVGDFVKKGDLLVSGNTYGIKIDKPIEQVHSSGDIYAYTWYDIKCLVENVKYEYTKSGKFVKIKGINGLLGSLDYWGGKNQFEKHTTTIEVKDVFIPFTDIKICSFYTKTVYELVRNEIILDEEQAMKYSEKLALEMLNKKLPKDAVVDSIDKKVSQDSYGKKYISLVANCTENIGIKQEITEPLPTNKPSEKPAIIYEEDIV